MEKSKNPVILSAIHHRQNPLESTTIIVIRRYIKSYLKSCWIRNNNNNNNKLFLERLRNTWLKYEYMEPRS
jgi:hypothetical protein